MDGRFRQAQSRRSVTLFGPGADVAWSFGWVDGVWLLLFISVGYIYTPQC